MGFSRELGSPEMVIIGRSIMGLHSGRCYLVCGTFLMAQSATAHCHRLCSGGFHGADRTNFLAMGFSPWMVLGMGEDALRV